MEGNTGRTVGIHNAHMVIDILKFVLFWEEAFLFSVSMQALEIIFSTKMTGPQGLCFLRGPVRATGFAGSDGQEYPSGTQMLRLVWGTPSLPR